MEPEDALYFGRRDDWRKWLEENHNKENEVWLVHYKKSSGKGGISLEEAVEEAICFGWIDGKLKKVDEERFILRFSPRKASSVWSRINKERAEKMIESGRMTEFGLNKIRDTKKTGSWEIAYTDRKRKCLLI
jgi:uncharacterized protein YdeI (YjbR/CyaY-like superfamily)